MDAVFVIDKPTGMTSHDVVDEVRGAVGQRRVGHTGTLDPDATGLLIVCVGRATRLVRFIQGGPKTYLATMRFGVETTTQDASGDVVARTSTKSLTATDVERALAALDGETEQVPPMVSSLKVGGERLHAKARRGEVVVREPRRVTVHLMQVMEVRPGDELEADVSVTCSGGTYVRTLAHDAGQALGVGAHLTNLRRVMNGGFDIGEATTLELLHKHAADGTIDQMVVSPGAALRLLPVAELNVREADDALHGRAFPARGLDGPYAAHCGDRFLGVFVDRDGRGRGEVVFAEGGT